MKFTQSVVLAVLVVVCCSASPLTFDEAPMSTDDGGSQGLSICLTACTQKTLEFVKRICGTGQNCDALFARIAPTVCGTTCSEKMTEESSKSLQQDRFTFYALEKFVEPSVGTPYVECWAKCLGKSIEQIKKWVEKCHKDIKCWLKVAGFKAMKCAAKCIK